MCIASRGHQQRARERERERGRGGDDLDCSPLALSFFFLFRQFTPWVMARGSSAGKRDENEIQGEEEEEEVK